METTRSGNSRSLVVALAAAAGVVSAPAGAAGFAVAVQSASALGNANAGVTASAEDASTAWFNPAGMAFLGHSEVAQAVHFDMPNERFRNAGSQPALGQPLGGEGGNAGQFSVIPPLYAVGRLDDRIAIGLTINFPFGQRTEYDGDWMGRFQALTSEVRTISVNPAMSWRIDDRFAVGGGLDVQWMQAKLTNAVNYSAVVAQGATASGLLTPQQVAALLDPARPDTIANLSGGAELKGDDLRLGWNAGALYRLDDRLRIGVQYRSQIRYTLQGTATFSPPTAHNPVAAGVIAAVSRPGGALSNSDVAVDLTLPASASAGVWWRPDPDWTLLFDAQWTGWSTFSTLRFVRADGSLLNQVVYDWQDTWRFAAGVNYGGIGGWLLRAGIAYDQSVIRNDANRDPRLPDSERLWLTAGARYDWRNDTWFDVALSYVQPKDASLVAHNNGSTAAFGLLNGDYRSRIAIVSLQVTKRF
ncbi:MAG: outer membrane protein transport protein [Burkholderiales bacterium]